MKNWVQFGLKTLTMLLVMTLIGCSSSPKSPDKAASVQGGKKGAERAEVVHVDGTLVVPGADFARYKKIIITALDIDNVEIIIPTLKKPWSFSEQNKRFMQEQYTQAAVINLIADGVYQTSLDPAANVLLLRSRIIRVESPKRVGSGDALVYDGAGIVTIVMELYDSSSEKMLGAITNSRDIGRIWEENNYASSSLQINQAFNHWLKSLRMELDALSRRQSPLDKLLVH